MEKKITQLNENDKNTLKARTAFILPDSPSAKGFSAEQNKRAQYEGTLLNFHWLQRLAKEVADADAELEKTIGDNYGEFDGYVTSNDREIADLKTEDARQAGLIADLDQSIRDVDSAYKAADAAFDSKKLDKSNGTAINLKIHQMADGSESATNKAYVDKLVSDAIKDTKKEHIKDFKVNSKANGVYEFVITLDNGVQFKQEIDTPDERILNPNRPPYINDNAQLVLTFVDGTSVNVDLSKLVDTYKGSENDYAKVEVLADNTISVTLKPTWINLLINARADYAEWTTNEQNRVTLYNKMLTLKTSVENTQSKLQPAVDLFKDGTILTQAQYDALADKSGVRFVEIA